MLSQSCTSRPLAHALPLRLLPTHCVLCLPQASPNLLDVDRIIIPVNCRNVHWTCCIIDVQNEEFVYYDSMGVSAR